MDKSPSAIDYSDIKEAVDDETSGEKSLTSSLSEQRKGWYKWLVDVEAFLN